MRETERLRELGIAYHTESKKQYMVQEIFHYAGCDEKWNRYLPPLKNGARESTLIVW
jgi:hypothetical protein